MNHMALREMTPLWIPWLTLAHEVLAPKMKSAFLLGIPALGQHSMTSPLVEMMRYLLICFDLFALRPSIFGHTAWMHDILISGMILALFYSPSDTSIVQGCHFKVIILIRLWSISICLAVEFNSRWRGWHWGWSGWLVFCKYTSAFFLSTSPPSNVSLRTKLYLFKILSSIFWGCCTVVVLGLMVVTKLWTS